LWTASWRLPRWSATQASPYSQGSSEQIEYKQFKRISLTRLSAISFWKQAPKVVNCAMLCNPFIKYTDSEKAAVLRGRMQLTCQPKTFWIIFETETKHRRMKRGGLIMRCCQNWLRNDSRIWSNVQVLQVVLVLVVTSTSTSAILVLLVRIKQSEGPQGWFGPVLLVIWLNLCHLGSVFHCHEWKFLGWERRGCESWEVRTPRNSHSFGPPGGTSTTSTSTERNLIYLPVA
jgi:hypothetical protein